MIVCSCCRRVGETVIDGDGARAVRNRLCQLECPTDVAMVDVDSGDYSDVCPVCDFCHSPDPRWEHQCGPFVLDLPSIGVAIAGEWHESSSWFACDTCVRLIDSPDVLLERSMQAGIALGITDATNPTSRRIMRLIQDCFRLARLGDWFERESMPHGL